MKRVLVACEYSGRVRDAFRLAGYDAWSCDFEPSERDPAFHYQDDVFEVVKLGWDAVIAFPPCTFLTKAYAWNWPNVQVEQAEALDFVRRLMTLPIDHIAIENPVGRIGTAIRKADQYVQPWHFGEPWQKTTGLWLKGFPCLVPAVTDKPTGLRPHIDSRPKTPNSISGAGGHRKSKDRSRTFQGIADAMAAQWGPVLAVG